MSRTHTNCSHDGCGRKANNLCPNSLCLAHCHDAIDSPGFQHCKRHEREWDNKQKYPRKRDRLAVPTSTRPESAQEEAEDQLAALTAPSASRKKRVRDGGGAGQDAFFLLAAEELLGAVEEEDANAGPQRQCPNCGLAVPEVGSFFWLHLSQCDPQAFGHFAEGSPLPPRNVSKAAPTDATLAAAADAARKRQQAAAALLAATLGRNDSTPNAVASKNNDKDETPPREQSLRELAGLAEQMASRLGTKNPLQEAELTTSSDALDTTRLTSLSTALISRSQGPFVPINEPLVKL